MASPPAGSWATALAVLGALQEGSVAVVPDTRPEWMRCCWPPQAWPEQSAEEWAPIDSRPLPPWFDSAKFGIMIHWGVYSVPAYGDEWYWKKMKCKEPSIASFHNRVYGESFNYTDFAPMFKAELFDPDNWARAFSEAGAKYVVFTSKHHDGFTLYRSNYTSYWNSVQTGPHRDLVGDLASSVRKFNMTLGLYYSLMEWYHPLYLQDMASKWKSRTFVEQKIMPEMRELVERYRPDLLWSDGAWEAPTKYWGSTEFLTWLYRDSPVKDTVVVNDRWGFNSTLQHGGYYSGADRQSPDPSLLKHKWENAMSLDKLSWSYSRATNLAGYFTAVELIGFLVSTVAYGGNLLLDIGPTADGLIVPILEERLLSIGKYLKVNGEAIYGSVPLIPPNASANGILAYFTASPRGDKIYYLTVGWPDVSEPVLVPLAGLSSAELLTKSKASITVKCAPESNGAAGSKCRIPEAWQRLRFEGELDANGFVLMCSTTRSKPPGNGSGKRISVDLVDLVFQ